MSEFMNVPGGSKYVFKNQFHKHHLNSTSGSTINLSEQEHRTIEVSRARRHGIVTEDELGQVARQVTSLTRQIQSLLDAQVTALESGRGNSANSETQSDRSYSQGKVVPVRQPQERPIGLSSARRGLTMAIRDLANAKTVEAEIVSRRNRQNQDNLSKVKKWQDRRAELEQSIAFVQNEDHQTHIRDLERESGVLREQIEAVESQLWELKSQHRSLGSQLAGLKNSAQSKTSSYNASLALVDQEIRQFLTHSQVGFRGPSESSLGRLDTDRRNLNMLVSQLEVEGEDLRQNLDVISTEGKALHDGSQLWKSTVERVVALESMLRSQLRSTTDASLEDLKKDFQSTLDYVEEAFSVAEENDWKLLVCCIGAELEALRTGQSILLGEESGHATPTRSNSVQSIDAARAEHNASNTMHDTEGPGPDLLVSQEFED